ALRGLRDLAAETGRWPDALDAQKRIIGAVGSTERSPETEWLAVIYYELGRVELGHSNPGGALAHFRNAVRADRSFLPAALARRRRRPGKTAARTASAGTRFARSACSHRAAMDAGWAVAALDLVFPALCPVCDAALGAGRRDPLCGRCWGAIDRLPPPDCDVCGAPSTLRADLARPRAPDARRVCWACTTSPPDYDYARSAAAYEGTLREALHAFKFS